MVSLQSLPRSCPGLVNLPLWYRSRSGPIRPSFYICLEEAQGIARSTLFGPVVRKEVIMAMLVLSIWSRNGWLPCGHALRMGMDMNLHLALDKLQRETGARSEEEERELGK